ncbi:MAG: hypothetical protein AB7W37_14245 [Syntrophobacteraceae bacterium]
MDLESIMTEHGLGSAAMSPCGIHVDEEGVWYYQGVEITRENIVQLFYENLHITSEGAFYIEWRGQRCALDSADTPFVIVDVQRTEPSKDGSEAILLSLRHLRVSEKLDPGTLYVGKDNVLYCRIRGGAFPARFSRPAYYRLAEWIEQDQDSGEFQLVLGVNRYLVACAEERNEG